jgi:hypothetical protein
MTDIGDLDKKLDDLLMEPIEDEHVKEIKSMGTRLDWVDEVNLMDENPEIIVDALYLMRILNRLNSLLEVSPDHLAVADISDTMKYLIDALKKCIEIKRPTV